MHFQELGDRASLYNLESPIRTTPTDLYFRDYYSATSKRNEYNAYEEDIAVVQFFFSKPTIPNLRKSARNTPTQFLSEVGGIFGLCLGCSLISVLEVIYWIGLKSFCNLNRN